VLGERDLGQSDRDRNAVTCFVSDGFRGAGCGFASQSRVDRFALEGQDAEDTFVDRAKRLVADETIQGFEAESEL
jgi:hypothetical protein